MSCCLAPAEPVARTLPIAIATMVTPRPEPRRVNRRRRIPDPASGLHDLRNVLTVISSATNLLRDGTNDHLRARLCDAIEQAAAAAYEVAESLIRESPSHDAVDICTTVASLCPLYEMALPAGVGLRLDLPADGWDVVADRRELERAVLNLVANAGDASIRGGKVVVRVRASGDALWLFVADNGSGIAPELLQRLGSEPITTKTKGSGLGLSQARRFATASGGKLRIRSRLTRGTVVALILPKAGRSVPMPG